jgi:hypothetical protein
MFQSFIGKMFFGGQNLATRMAAGKTGKRGARRRA